MAKLAYLDCQSGISGDMVLGALVDAGVDLAALNAAVGSLGLPEVRLVAHEVRKHGFRATQIIVEHPHEHAHRHLHHIMAMIDRGQLTERQRTLARQIFTRLGEAEAKVHGIGIEKIHFHEVGAADSIADIVGAAVGFDLLGADEIVASPVAVGGGRITIAHGEVSVPAPATAELLRGVPLVPTTVQTELATPTGAAILTTLASRFGPVPAMQIDAIGYGAGQKDFEQQANVLRLLVGQTAASGSEDHDEIVILETNLDDTSGELVGHCVARLWDAGALDVYTAAIQMKKNRPGVTLTVLCRPADAAALEAIVLRETTTLGVRRHTAARRVLPRAEHAVETELGRVAGKVAWLDGIPRFTPEYEDCRRVADERRVPLRAVYEAALRAFQPDAVQRSPEGATANSLVPRPM